MPINDLWQKILKTIPFYHSTGVPLDPADWPTHGKKATRIRSKIQKYLKNHPSELDKIRQGEYL